MAHDEGWNAGVGCAWAKRRAWEMRGMRKEYVLTALETWYEDGLITKNQYEDILEKEKS